MPFLSTNTSAECSTTGRFGLGSINFFGAGGTHAASLEELLSDLRKRTTAGATVLIKGSRFMRMERVVAALTGESPRQGAH